MRAEFDASSLLGSGRITIVRYRSSRIKAIPSPANTLPPPFFALIDLLPPPGSQRARFVLSPFSIRPSYFELSRPTYIPSALTHTKVEISDDLSLPPPPPEFQTESQMRPIQTLAGCIPGKWDPVGEPMNL